MRVNIYAEELTETIQIIKKVADTGNEFIGIRFVLDSPTSLHCQQNDDDRSGVTFWIPGSKFKGYKKDWIKALFLKAISELDAA